MPATVRILIVTDDDGSYDPDFIRDLDPRDWDEIWFSGVGSPGPDTGQRLPLV